MDKELMEMVLRMLYERAEYWMGKEDLKDIAYGRAYHCAATMVGYTLRGDYRGLAQFDTYHNN